RKLFETAISQMTRSSVLSLLHLELIGPLRGAKIRVCEIANETVQLDLRHGPLPREVGAELPRLGYQADRVSLFRSLSGMRTSPRKSTSLRGWPERDLGDVAARARRCRLFSRPT